MDKRHLRAHAAHFALLRRLAPSLRHRLMGDLQPVTLLTELAERQLAKAQPDLERTRDTLGKAREQVRTAVGSMTGVLAWITGEEHPTVMVGDGIDACIGLLRTDSEAHGVRIVRGSREGSDLIVGRRALRTVTAACFIAAADMRPTPAEIRVSCLSDAGVALLRIDSAHAGAGAHEDAMVDEHPLGWDDVLVIADDAGVELELDLDPLRVEWRLPAAG